MKMAHTCVRVKDLEASLDFYQKAFNFEESRRRDFPENKFTLVYSLVHLLSFLCLRAVRDKTCLDFFSNTFFKKVLQ